MKKQFIGALIYLVVCLAAAMIILAVTGCAGGGGHGAAATTQTASDPPPVSSDPPPTTQPPAVSPPPVYGPPTVACPDGTTNLYISQCACPQGDANGSSCVVPIPVAPSPPPTQTTLSVSLSAASDQLALGQSVRLTWHSVGTIICEISGPAWSESVATSDSATVTPSQTPTTTYSLVCSGPAGGTATDSVTIQVSGGSSPPPASPPPPPPPPPFTITLTANAAALVDSTGCPADSLSIPCQTYIGVTDSFGTNVACSMDGGPQQFSNTPFPIGPFAADGPQTFNFVCTDPLTSQTASGAITIPVQRPYVPVPDQFAIAGSNPYTFTWSTSGTDGCYVQQADNFGNTLTLTQGGGTSGSATTGFLSPSLGPYVFTLMCGGVPDRGVPTIGV